MKTPADRYGSVSALVNDIRACLADEAVAAYPENVVLRINRWRKRYGLRTVGMILLPIMFALFGLVIVFLIETGFAVRFFYQRRFPPTEEMLRAELLDMPLEDSNRYYEAARFVARCVSQARADTNLSPEVRKITEGTLGQASVILLKETGARGWRQGQNVLVEKDFTILHGRYDFDKVSREFARDRAEHLKPKE
jgi:hypothetical protein